MPDVAVPIATFLPWNLRGEGHAVGEGCSASGATIPFAVNASAKAGGIDPRQTLAGLYTGRADYQAKVAAQADALVASGYLLQEDANNVYRANSRTISSNLIRNP